LHFLRRAVAVFPDRTAVVHGERRLTYRELGDRAARLAGALAALGVERGDRVAILSPNTPAMLEAHYGVPAAGGVLVALNTRYSPGELQLILEHSGARVLLVDEALAEHVAGSPVDHVVPIADTGAPDDPYERVLAGATPLVGEVTDEDALLAVNYTSGTTGRPKGVMVTHRGAYLQTLANVLAAGLHADSSYLWVLPMFHCNGWTYTWAVTAAGATHVCLRQVEPEAIWRLLAEEQITDYCCAPAVQTMILESPSARDLPRAVTVQMGGAPPSPTLLARMRARNFAPRHLYGLTETLGPHTGSLPTAAIGPLPDDELAVVLARQGHVLLAGEEVRVADEAGADVPADGATIGEVLLRGNTIMAGYFGEEPGAAPVDGWLRSGDLAVRHPDGAIELRDRSKDLIVSGGENISTIEVEQVLARHAAVLECAVVAIPDDRWGERPKAFVDLREGASATGDELVAHCRARLAHFKCPDQVAFGPLPKTSTGKIEKRVLRDREWAGRDRRVN
jgi:fatty-acyl-CoA synthase